MVRSDNILIMYKRKQIIGLLDRMIEEFDTDLFFMMVEKVVVYEESLEFGLVDGR